MLMLLVMGCSDKKSTLNLERMDQQGVQPLSEQSRALNIYPDDPTIETLISVSTDSPLLTGAKVHWYVNGVEDKSSVGLNYTSHLLKKGDTVKAAAVRNGKEFESNEVTIRNTPPSIIVSELLPAQPRVDSTFTVSLKAKDVDNDMINYKYKWSVNDAFVSEQPYLNTELRSGDKVAIEITPYDKEDSGKTVRITRKVLNSLPVFSESKPVFDGTVYSYQMQVTDPDNDALSFKLRKGPDGMNIDPASGLITWNVKPEDKGYHEIEVQVTDGNGGTLIIPFSTTIGFQ